MKSLLKILCNRHTRVNFWFHWSVLHVLFLCYCKQQALVSVRRAEEPNCVHCSVETDEMLSLRYTDGLRQVLDLLCVTHLHQEFSPGDTSLSLLPTTSSPPRSVSAPFAAMLCFTFLDLGNVLFQRVLLIVEGAPALRHLLFSLIFFLLLSLIDTSSSYAVCLCSICSVTNHVAFCSWHGWALYIKCYDLSWQLHDVQHNFLA